MKNFIGNVIRTVVTFIKAHTVVAVATAAVVTVTAVAVPVGIHIANNGREIAPADSTNHTKYETVSIESSPVSSVTQTSTQETISNSTEATTSTSNETTSEQTTSVKPKPEKEDNVSSNSAKPTQPSSSVSKPSSTQNKIDTTPSETFLESVGMTLEELRENTNALATCRHCGRAKDNKHHRFTKDKNCPDCGVFVEKYSCHICD